MNFNFSFTSPITQKIWHNFEQALINKLKVLPTPERSEIKLEILSHLYDSANSDAAVKEEERLLNAIQRLGSEEEYLLPLISDILISQKIVKGNPMAILQGLIINGQKGILHLVMTAILGFGYFTSLMIFVMALLHLVNKDVGLWINNDGTYSLSFANQPAAIQWLPDYFSIIGISSSLLVYWLINRLLHFYMLRKN
jgi:hypothetical protein